jgi:hypothetical protein
MRAQILFGINGVVSGVVMWWYERKTTLGAQSGNCSTWGRDGRPVLVHGFAIDAIGP